MAKFGISAATIVLSGAVFLTGVRTKGAETPPPEVVPIKGDNAKNATAHSEIAEATPAEKKIVAEGNNAFALDLYAKLSAQEQGNLFFSPYSISTALAMTYAGARGETAAQMEKALHFSLGQARLHSACRAWIRDFNEEETDHKKSNEKKSRFQLNVANRLWGMQGLAFHKDFLDLTQNYYGAGLVPLDFSKATEESRKTINAWVERQTQEKIKDLIRPGDLTTDSRLVLTNAIYFKGDWANAFEAKNTKQEAFKLSEEKNIQVPMMARTGTYKYYLGAMLENQRRGNAVQILELPYSGNELSMFILMPHKEDGSFCSLEGVNANLNPANLTRWLQNLQETQVRVSLPKFKLTWGTQDLCKPLESLGMTDAFNADRANFSAITAEEQLYISLVLHKAFVDVNEEGTEAAAATAVVMVKPTGMPRFEEPQVLRADRPFLFLIRENATGGILFLGRVTDPR